MGILQCCHTSCKTWWFGWPSLSCQRLLDILHGSKVKSAFLLHEFTKELTIGQTIESNTSWKVETKCEENCKGHQNQHCLEVRLHW